MRPTIVIEDWQGRHNSSKRYLEIEKAGLYRDSHTVCITPTRGLIPAKAVQNWLGLVSPMNQGFSRLFVIGMEIGYAYNSAIEQILAHPVFSKWPFILTLEEDNLPPYDGLVKLIEAMHNNPEFSAIGGLYWTKGEGGQPMCYGDPTSSPKTFYPFPPVPDGMSECNALGMGFTLFRTSLFKELPKPWFKSVQIVKEEGGGATGATQDMYFFIEAGKKGHRFACDSRVKVGHYDYQNDIIW